MVMVLGAIMCPVDKTREISKRLAEIREKHHLPAAFEVKWAKVSPAKLDYYMDLVDYFFDDDDLKFRGVVAHKGGLQHERFHQTHDDWYYKMLFQLLKNLLKPTSSYRIYLDKKDTRSADKVRRLHTILSNNALDFDKRIVERVQNVQSHEILQMQLSDLLLGAVSYSNRGLASSSAKLALIARIRERSGYGLLHSTLLREEKFNLFHWNQPSYRGNAG